MNILFLSETFPPHGSGAELATQYYANLLGEQQIKVIVLTNRFAGEPALERRRHFSIRRISMFKNSGSVKYSLLKRPDTLFSPALNSLIEWADIVYVPRFWFSAILAAKAHGKPVVVHLHDYIPVCSLSSLYNQEKNSSCGQSKLSCPSCIYRFESSRGKSSKAIISSTFLNSTIGKFLPKIITLADAIICVSEEQKSLVSEKLPIVHGKIHVIYNPFPLMNKFEAGNDFGYFGGTDALKGFNVLIKSMITLKTRANKIKIHATKIDGINECLKQELTDIGFVPYGKLDSQEFEKMYSQVGWVLVPSIWPEPWPYVVVEALVKGRVVIGSKIGGISEQVNGCKGAFLSEPGNFRELAASMEFVSKLSHEELFNLGSQNRDHFLRKFNNDSSVRKFIGLCDHIVA